MRHNDARNKYDKPTAYGQQFRWKGVLLDCKPIMTQFEEERTPCHSVQTSSCVRTRNQRAVNDFHTQRAARWLVLYRLQILWAIGSTKTDVTYVACLNIVMSLSIN